MRSALVLLAVAAVVVAPGAEARSPYKLVGEGHVVTDGERYAVLQEDGRDPRVMDDATGRSYDLTRPADGCRVQGVSEGHALWRCSGGTDAEPPPFTNIQTGAPRPVPGWEPFMRWWRLSGLTQVFSVSGRFPAISRLGRHWIETSWECYHCGPAYQYLNWRSGALVSGLPDSTVRLADPDDRDLEVPLCAPLRRRVDPDAFGSAYVLPYDYQPPWGLPSLRPRVQGERLELDRCGHRRPIVVSGCRKERCSSSQLGAGYLTWAEGREAYAYVLSRRRRLHLPAAPRFGGGSIAVHHTRRTVYVTTDAGVYARRSPR